MDPEAHNHLAWEAVRRVAVRRRRLAAAYLSMGLCLWPGHLLLEEFALLAFLVVWGSLWLFVQRLAPLIGEVGPLHHGVNERRLAGWAPIQGVFLLHRAGRLLRDSDLGWAERWGWLSASPRPGWSLHPALHFTFGLPTVGRPSPPNRDAESNQALADPGRCPCCRYRTLPGRGLSAQCAVCRWVEDGRDEAALELRVSGSNGGLSLSEARINFQRYGALQASELEHVRAPRPEER